MLNRCTVVNCLIMLAKVSYPPDPKYVLFVGPCSCLQQDPSSKAADNAMKLMNMDAMPKTNEWTRTPAIKRPLSADMVEMGLNETPPPLVKQQSDTCYFEFNCAV